MEVKTQCRNLMESIFSNAAKIIVDKNNFFNISNRCQASNEFRYLIEIVIQNL